MQGLSTDDHLDWLGLPATQIARENILKMIRQEEAYIGEGATVDMDSSDVTHGKTNRAVGMIAGYKNILETVFQNISPQQDSLKEG